MLKVALFLGFEEVDERVGLFPFEVLLVFVPVYLGDDSELLLTHVSQVVPVSKSLSASLQLLNYRVLLLEQIHHKVLVRADSLINQRS